MTSNRWRARRIAAIVATGTLVATACGGDADTDTAADDPATTPIVADEPVEGEPVEGGASEPTAAPDEPPAATTEPADEPIAEGSSTDESSTAEPSGTEPADDEPATTEPSGDPIAEAPEILRISAPLVGGGELDLATVADRPLLLWFWAPF